jgi:hypothetical protein
MANVSPKRLTKWLQVRSDDDMLAVLDELRADIKPEPTRSDLVRRLIYEAHKRAERRK